MNARVPLVAALLLALTACVDGPQPKDWSLFIEFDGQDYFVADHLTKRDCMHMVYEADRWTNGAANYRCEEITK